MSRKDGELEKIHQHTSKLRTSTKPFIRSYPGAERTNYIVFRRLLFLLGWDIVECVIQKLISTRPVKINNFRAYHGSAARWNAPKIVTENGTRHRKLRNRIIRLCNPAIGKHTKSYLNYWLSCWGIKVGIVNFQHQIYNFCCYKDPGTINDTMNTPTKSV